MSSRGWGLYPDAPKPPLVPGYEVAGVVEAVGSDTTGLREGDRVVALTRFGGYATQVIVPAPYVFPIPDGVRDTDAASVPVNYLTAYLALYRFANLAPEETVLIHGAGGGVGIAATQLAAGRGATIIGTASPSKHPALHDLGVRRTLDSRDPDLLANVRRLTNNRGVDVVLDPIGGRSFATSYRLLAPLGRLIVYGVSAIAPGRRRSWWHAGRTIWQNAVVQTDVAHEPQSRPSSASILRICGKSVNSWPPPQLAAAMRWLLEELREGRLRPVVAQTFRLDEAAEAHHFLQSRANLGKVILVAPPSGTNR